MPFHLDITFAGLCLLVRDSDAAGRPRRLHVLMPKVSHPHLPTLAYRKEYEVPGTNPNVIEKRTIAGKQLDLSHLSSTGGLNLAFPSDVFDFDGAPLGPRKVARSWLDGAALPAGVRFRMKLGAGGYRGHGPSGIWFLRAGGGESSHRMTTIVHWRLENVRLDRDELELDLGGGMKHTLKPLPGPDGAPAIHLMIVHLTTGEHAVLGTTVPRPTRCLPNREPGPHFLDYFPLLDPSAGVTPQFDRVRTEAAGECNRASTVPLSLETALAPKVFAGGSEFTCMVATAPAIPG